MRSVPKTARGFFGALFVFYVGVKTVFDLLQDATYAVSNAGAIVEFLTSTKGNAVILFLGFFLLLWSRHARMPETEPSSQPVAPDPTAGKEAERLKARLQKVEQENKRLRASLADPTAERERKEGLARRRALEVAQDLQKFWNARKYTDYYETVARFRQRHEWKVDEVRERLEGQKRITDQERDTLTFRVDDPPDKIREMAEILRAVGMGE